ncbi:hypothetical protein J6590_081690 [Homalodisca vitripennis]|nr:hypothetical protein J6590_081690 [Homalodisca vitripennis]
MTDILKVTDLELAWGGDHEEDPHGGRQEVVAVVCSRLWHHLLPPAPVCPPPLRAAPGPDTAAPPLRSGLHHATAPVTSPTQSTLTVTHKGCCSLRH